MTTQYQIFNFAIHEFCLVPNVMQFIPNLIQILYLSIILMEFKVYWQNCHW